MIIYGEAGIGKTTFATSAPAPIVIQTEDGLGVLDAPRFPLATTFDDVLESLQVLATENHEFKSVVVDSLDWLEPLIWQATCKRLGVKHRSTRIWQGLCGDHNRVAEILFLRNRTPGRKGHVDNYDSTFSHSAR